MRLRTVVALSLAFAAWPILARESAARDLTFDERVQAARAIEWVSYTHQQGAARPFDEAVPRAFLEQKVLTYLRQSVALESVWHTPVTAAALRAEMRRITAQTRLPERLREIEAALGNDAFLIQECYARPILVDRLARNFYAFDPSLHDAERPSVGGTDTVVEEREAFVVRNGAGEEAWSVPKRSWDDWWSASQTRFDPRQAGPVAEEGGWTLGGPGTRETTAAPPEPSAYSCAQENIWLPVEDSGVPDSRFGATAVWTGSVMIVWGGSSGLSLNTGGRYDPVTDTWSSVSTVGAPSARSGHTAVWTGQEMIVWGGSLSGGAATNTGGRYDPVTDTWGPISLTGVPAPRSGHAAVWTGSLMVVWGSGTNTGGRYDPASDTWTATSTLNAPSSRTGFTGVWAGSRMVVWGGRAPLDPTGLNTGGRYDPASDTWTPTATANAPQGRERHTAVWTDSRMVVWGGHGTGYLDSGGRYDPVADAWQPTTTLGAPAPRQSPTSVWLGGEVIVWGGSGLFGGTNTGARYDPAADTWTPMSGTGAPVENSGGSAISTGSLMIVWGGGTNTGRRYDPASDTWTPTSTGIQPGARYGHTAVWTGREMIVWGGYGNGCCSLLNSGGRYDPVSATWSPTSTLDAPTGRGDHTAVWTGSEMVVWGGQALGFGNLFDTGGRYDPVTDTWRPTSMAGAPEARRYHTAVWTGQRMVVWGGYSSASGELNTGGRYDPTTDAWAPTATEGAPDRRYSHVAVWADNLMVVYGGDVAGAGYGTTGGRYDPVTNAWAPTSTVGAPPGQDKSTMVWTGRYVVVWGGSRFDDIFVDTGGRYDPLLDVWSPVTMAGSPSPRAGHTAVWTGHRMVVWGGRGGSCCVSVGGREYDPVGNSWAPVTANGAPIIRYFHSVVWTGDEMIVWGGLSNYLLAGGGAYLPTWPADQDGDGFRVCDGDCDDHDATVHPGAAETCDGRDANCDGVVIPRDVTPPALLVAADPAVLWPPNHALVPVHVSWLAQDACDPTPVVTLVSVTSSEPDNAPGSADGNTIGDIAGADLGTADTDLFLRAERSASGPGRTYRLEFEAVDAFGNARRVFALVTVPPQRGLVATPGTQPPGLRPIVGILPAGAVAGPSGFIPRDR